MTSEGESNGAFEAEFKPRGTIAFAVAFVVVLLLMWFSVYIIMLLRGTTI